VGLDFSQQVDQLYLNLDPEAIVPLGIETLQWELYTASAADPFWTRVGLVGGSFNQELFRLELDIGRQAQYLKVVARNTTTQDLVISGLVPLGLLTEDTDLATRRTSHLTNAGLRVKLTPTLTASSRLTLEQNDSEGDESRTDASRRSLSGNLRWAPNPYLSPSLGYSETSQEQSGAPDLLNRSYSLMLATLPLPTLNVTLGARFTDRFSDSRLTSISDIYSLTSTARLYPDLTAGFNATYSRTVRAQGETEATAATLTDTYSTRLTLNARLRPSLTADLTANYQQSNSTAVSSPTPVESEISGSDSTLSLVWRPSDLLSTRFTHLRRWSGADTPDVLSGDLNLALLRTPITRLTFRYLVSHSDRTFHRLGLDGSWDISRNLVLRSRFNYTIAEQNLWNIQTSLALRL
jgi:hypothetical protein